MFLEAKLRDASRFQRGFSSTARLPPSCFDRTSAANPPFPSKARLPADGDVGWIWWSNLDGHGYMMCVQIYNITI